MVLANWFQFSATGETIQPSVESRMLLWCEKGSGRLEVNGVARDFQPGDWTFLPWKHRIHYQPDTGGSVPHRGRSCHSRPRDPSAGHLSSRASCPRSAGAFAASPGCGMGGFERGDSRALWRGRSIAFAGHVHYREISERGSRTRRHARSGAASRRGTATGSEAATKPRSTGARSAAASAGLYSHAPQREDHG